MKNKLQKLNIIFGVLILVSILFIGAGVAETVDSGSCGDNLTWVLTDDGTLTISGTGAMYDYGYSGAPWFQYRSIMTKLVLPDGLTTIGNQAFYECSNITGSLTIPNNVTKIGQLAFYYCYGFNGCLTLPNKLTMIEGGAFSRCSNLTGPLTIPNNVIKIGWNAFQYCHGFDGDLTIPNSVTSIGYQAFDGCNNLTGPLVIPNTLTKIEDSTFQNCRGLTGSLVIPSSVTTIGDQAFGGCRGFTGSLIIPDGVTTIGISAFYGCRGLTSVSIPASVTTIDNQAFLNCYGFTESLILPNNLMTVGRFAFEGCSGLTSVSIPASVTMIGKSAFSCLHSNSIIYAECPASLVLGNYSTDKTALAISNADNSYTITVNTSFFPSGFSLTDKNAPRKDGYRFDGWYANPEYTGDKVTKVSNGQTLYAKWLEPIIIDSGRCGDNLTWVLTDDGRLNISGTGAMYDYILANGAPWHQYGTQMTKLTLENGITTIGEYAFEGCEGFTGKLILPDSISMINESAFYGCTGFTGSLEIPANVTTIKYSAFRDCSGFTGVLGISANVTSIGDWAFDGCTGLTAFNVDINNTYYSSDEQGLLYDKYKFNLFECPGGKKGAVVVPSNVGVIFDHVFRCCSGITSVNLPSGITSIGRWAFDGCTGLTSITLPSDLRVISVAAFRGCSGLTNVLIPANVTAIGNAAFEGCSGLTSVFIPANVTAIGNAAFERCNNLPLIDVDINNPNYSSDYQGILYNKNKTILLECPGGKTGGVIIPSNVSSIDTVAFRECSGITSVTIPPSVISIGYQAFCDCSGLTNLTIPAYVSEIGNMALYNLHSNSIVYAEGDLDTIYRISPERSAIAILNRENTYKFTVSGYHYYEGFPLTDANAPTKVGYLFEGWYTNLEYTGDNVTNVSNNQILYSKWTAGPAKEYANTSGTIILDSGYTVNKINVSNTSIGNITFVYDQNVSAPTRSGYHDQKAFGDAFNITLIDGSFNGGKAKIFFNISKSDLGTRDTSNIMLAHFCNETWEYLTTVKESEDSVNVQFSAETTSFSPFYPMYMVPGSSQQDYSSSSSRQSGGSYILPEGEVAPTVNPTVAPTQASETPVVNPTAKPTTQPTQQSPAPFLGILAGLGATGLIYRMRR